MPPIRNIARKGIDVKKLKHISWYNHLLPVPSLPFPFVPMRFLHISKGDGVTKETFTPPTLNAKENTVMHPYNLWGGFYLAMADENGDSMWQKTREILATKCPDGPDPWLIGSRHYFVVDFAKHGIYLVDSKDDLIAFFARYGCFEQSLGSWGSLYSVCTKKNGCIDMDMLNRMKKRDRLRIKRHKLLKILNAFLENLDTNIFASDTFEAVKQSRTIRNMPLVKFANHEIVQPKKITLRFLADVVRTKEVFEAFVGDLDPTTIQTTLRTINYPLLRKDGYNGIYYSTNIITFADVGKDIIAMPDLETFPDVLGDTSIDDRMMITKNIQQYMQWLWSDTLVLWKWIW
jgi:hypothetical protein